MAFIAYSDGVLLSSIIIMRNKRKTKNLPPPISSSSQSFYSADVIKTWICDIDVVNFFYFPVW